MVHSKVIMLKKQNFLKFRIMLLYTYFKGACPDVLFLMDLRKMISRMFNSSKHGNFSNRHSLMLIEYISKKTPDNHKEFVFHWIQNTFACI